MNIIRPISISILFLFSIVIGVCQPKKIFIGIEGAPSLTFLWGNSILLDEAKPTFGLNGGLFLLYPLNKKISFRPTISYERKGFVLPSTPIFLDDINSVDTGSVYQLLHFLTIPILFHISLDKWDRVYLIAGPYLGYLLSETIRFRTESFRRSETRTPTVFDRWDAGISAGLGIRHSVSKNWILSLELRNNLGLLNLMSNSNIENESVRTNSTNLFFSAAYRL